MPSLKGSYDKNLMVIMIVAMCALALLAPSNDKLAAFALQAASGCLGCLLTLVTAHRNDPATPPDPTSVVTEASSVVKTVTKTDPLEAVK